MGSSLSSIQKPASSIASPQATDFKFLQLVGLRRSFAKIILIFLLAPLLFAAQTAHAGTSITVTGAWFETIDKNDLISGAGSDLKDTYTSVSGQVSIDISGTTGPTDAWRVDVRKQDDNWNNNLHQYVRRTSDGSGGSVGGGASYQSVTDIDTPFFSGSGDATDIKVQLRLTGVSIQIPPSSYSAVLYYTVVDIE